MRALTRRRRERLALVALEDWCDESAGEVDLDLLRAIARVPEGTELPVEIPDGTDGETDEERVALALDFFGI